MNPDQVGRSEWIETFRSRSRRDLRAGWRRSGAAQAGFFLDESWGATHRPDWAKRGLLIWPRGRQWLRLEQRLSWPDGWSDSDSCRARLVLSWWAEQMRLWVDGVLVHEGDLFDTACRWPLPGRCRQGAALDLVLELCSPLHDDGALISSHLDLEPQTAGPDPEGTLLRPWSCIWRWTETCRRIGRIWIPAVQRRRLLLQRTCTRQNRREGRCIGWVMPISIWLGFGRSLTPGRPLNAPSDQRWR